MSMFFFCIEPSTSKACFPTEGLVDLAGSDSDTHEEVKSFFKVWNKFVPNATIQIGFPPSILLPKGIPFRDTIYELDVKRLNDNRSDSDLEYYVDELNLNSSPCESDNDGNSNANASQQSCRSWKEWKQVAVQDARGVLNDSLLASSGNKSNGILDSANRLYLWKNSNSSIEKEEYNSITVNYDLYHPSVNSNLSKHRLKSEFQPSYVVAVVR
jgi:hypothetical protein